MAVSRSEFASKSLVIIPAHNEEECVAGVVLRLRERGFARIRVVANACTDGTVEQAKAAGAEVCIVDRAGYGLACWVGALNTPPDVEWLVYCNADASDDLDALDRFAEVSERCDLILGARSGAQARATMTPAQRFGNWLAPCLIHVLWGVKFDDLGPQRAIRVPAYHRLAMRDRGLGWTVEMQVRAIEEHLRIREIPVQSFPRVAGTSKISGNLRGSFAAGWIILTTIAALALRRVFPRRSRPANEPDPIPAHANREL